MKKKLFLKCILFAIICAMVSTPLQLFNSAVIEGVQGKPEFVTLPFISYTILMKIMFAIGYLILGYRIPIKNTVLRAFTYLMLIWLSNYMPQVLGMLGGDGAIIEGAFSINIFVCDSFAYLIDGIILGIIMKNYQLDYIKERVPKKGSLLHA